MKVLPSQKKRKRSQLGFTLAEMMIAIVISAVILVGSVELVNHMVIASAQNRAKTMSMLQVQYVGFWITEDAVQARADGISLGDAQGFPLTIDWTAWNGDENKVVYSVDGSPLWTLTREQLLKKNGQSVFTSYGNTTVGQLLDPAGTRFWWVTGNLTAPVLGGNVTAVGDPYATKSHDRFEASRTYMINPRSK